MSMARQNRARLALAVTLWCAAWSCLMVALARFGEPWPWGGLAIFLAVAAMTATVWAMVGVTTERAVQHLCQELDRLHADHDVLPRRLARAIVDASNVSRL